MTNKTCFDLLNKAIGSSSNTRHNHNPQQTKFHMKQQKLKPKSSKLSPWTICNKLKHMASSNRCFETVVGRISLTKKQDLHCILHQSVESMYLFNFHPSLHCFLSEQIPEINEIQTSYKIENEIWKCLHRVPKILMLVWRLLGLRQEV